LHGAGCSSKPQDVERNVVGEESLDPGGIKGIDEGGKERGRKLEAKDTRQGIALFMFPSSLASSVKRI